jgi:pyruvate dehydrogenase E1 component alpha subunit/2-oxoisovalerate dehydrogenase E1 component alpha subunit
MQELVTSDKPSADRLTRGQLIELYYFLKLNRGLEERLSNLYRQGKVVGGLYRSLGQEACSIGSAYALERGDIFTPLIRNLGAILVRGGSAHDIFCQYMAKADSPTRGRDLNLHFGWLSPEGSMPSVISMLGDMIPILTGAVMAERMNGRRTVALTWIGDGGTSTGAFHEGLNLACVQKAPLVLIVENNGWAYSTPTARQTANPKFVDRANAYGCFGQQVDGNDVLAVYDATRAAIQRARQGLGPSLIEALTMRMKGHAEHDDMKYVPPEQVEMWAKRDPIARFEEHLLSRGFAPSDLEAMASRVEQELLAELTSAEASPMPEGHTGRTDVYFGSIAEDATPEIVRQSKSRRGR